MADQRIRELQRRAVLGDQAALHQLAALRGRIQRLGTGWEWTKEFLTPALLAGLAWSGADWTHEIPGDEDGPDYCHGDVPGCETCERAEEDAITSSGLKA